MITHDVKPYVITINTYTIIIYNLVNKIIKYSFKFSTECMYIVF